MVGNSVRSDILPVLSLGGHAVHIPYPLLWEHEHVDHDEDLDELASISELPAALAHRLTVRVAAMEHTRVPGGAAPRLGGAARCRSSGRTVGTRRRLPGMDGGRPGLAHRRGAPLLGHDRRRAGDEPRRASPSRRARTPTTRCSPSPRRRPGCSTTSSRPPTRRRRSGRGRASTTSASSCGGWPRRRPSTASTPSGRPAASTVSIPSSPPTASTSSWSTSCGWVAPDAVPVGGSVHLHCTDVDGEWIVAADDDGADVVTREHAKGDAAVRGPAHDLLMVLWRRRPLDTVEVFGDRAVAERLIATDPPGLTPIGRLTACAGGPRRRGGRPPCAGSATPAPGSGGCSR